MVEIIVKEAIFQFVCLLLRYNLRCIKKNFLDYVFKQLNNTKFDFMRDLILCFKVIKKDLKTLLTIAVISNKKNNN